MGVTSKKKLTQYERLAGTLRDRIAAGTYARGDKLPSEMELMDESGLSRSTVRHALKVLVDEGLVRTERGRGAVVAHTPALPHKKQVF
ncbi:GntR family transcriptional regulator [Collinsella sp. HCP28S3_B9]|uniref:GntR family transcriptional regulator n=1 Tax=Collinsella sp. HCP28S3_B9 TaxID=3438920 RepID=UPI003F8A0F1A